MSDDDDSVPEPEPPSQPPDDPPGASEPPTVPFEPDGEPGEPDQPGPRRFQPLSLHRTGGQGRVFRAFDSELNREVAYKEIRPEFAARPAVQRRFLFEAEVTGRLEHPGIVPVYGLGRDRDGQPYYAMRFLDGPTLADAVRVFHADRRPAADRALEFRRLLGRFISVCQTVAFAHSRGVIHRDLKPANVMLGPFGETLIVDWGAARRLQGFADTVVDEPVPADVTGHSLPGSRIGTPAYWSPEQANGWPTLHDERTDVYGLGAILFEMVAGEPPHRDGRHAEVPPGPLDVRPEGDAALDGIVRQALALERDDRFQSAHAVADEVERWLADQPVAATRTAVNALSRLSQEHPDDDVLAEQLARQRANLGLLLSGLGRAGDASSELSAAAAIFSRLARTRDEPRLSAEEANCYLALGRSLRAAGRVDDAAAAEGMAAEIYRGLIVARPDEYRQAHASIMITWARMPHPPDGTAAASGDADPNAGTTTFGTLEPSDLAPPPDGDGGTDGFTPLRALGQGGLGRVFLARDNTLDREVAIKVLNEHHRGSAGAAARMLREMRVTAALEHPNIVRVYSHGRRSGGGQAYLVMEYLPGRDFGTVLREIGAGWSAAHLDPLAQVCDALAYAHGRGIVHRDPKPSNVMVLPTGRAVLFDWGLSKVLGTPDDHADDAGGAPPRDPELTHEGSVMGTPAYLSPEQARGDLHALGTASDVFIVGAGLFHTLTGTTPLAGNDVYDRVRRMAEGGYPRPREVRADVPPELDDLCARAMAFRPEERPTAAALGEGLRAFLTAQAARGRRRGFWGWLRRS